MQSRAVGVGSEEGARGVLWEPSKGCQVSGAASSLGADTGSHPPLTNHRSLPALGLLRALMERSTTGALGLLEQMTTRGVTGNNRNVFSHGAGGGKSNVRVASRTFVFGLPGRRPTLSLAASGGSWRSRLVAMTLRSPPVFSHGPSTACASVCPPSSSSRTSVSAFTSYSNQI